MYLTLEKGQWGYFIDPMWFKHPIFPDRDIPEHSFVIIKYKQWVDDLERDVIQTDYRFVRNGRLERQGKGSMNMLMAELMIDFAKNHNYIPTEAHIGKITKNMAHISYAPDKWDRFPLKFKKADLGMDPAEFMGLLTHPPSPSQVKQFKQSQSTKIGSKNVVDTHSVAGSKGNTYTVKIFDDGSKECDCAHFAFRLKGTGRHCKHIKSV